MHRCILRCSVIVVGFNNAPDLPRCLDHLLMQEYPDFEIILVDNASHDETKQIAAAYAERVRFLALESNVGFASGNNLGAAIASGDVLVFVNPDTEVHAGWLAELVRPLLHDQTQNYDQTQGQWQSQQVPVGMTTSTIVHMDQRYLLNACGNDITWTGLTVCRGLDQPQSAYAYPSDVTAVSGASFAIRKSLFHQLGGFDDDFFLYYEDTDLSLRVQLAGYRILHTPRSVVAHRYVFKFNAPKAYYQERNRWLALFKTLRFPTLLLLLPGLLLGEAMAWFYAAMYGSDHLRAKMHGWQWLWQHRRQIWHKRRMTQRLRQVRDRNIIGQWSPHLRFAGTVPSGIAQILETCTMILLHGYGSLCRRLAVW